jgi:hypothetical protein
MGLGLELHPELGIQHSHANPQCHRIIAKIETEASSSIELRDYETS